jgi:tripartite-type tricarboxylate transporter receptor subunit TctC
VIVDNRPGANASIGMGIVARAPADGYTIVIAPVGPWAVNPHLYKLPYDVQNDFAPVIHITTTPGVLVVHPSVPAKTVKDLIALATQRPGELNYGSTGVGGFGHMCGELFTLMTKVRMTHVPHKSIAAALSDVMGGHLQVLFNVASPTIPQIRAGKVRVLATTGAARFEALPDVPTIAEAGVPGYENTTWNGIAALRARRRRPSRGSTRNSTRSCNCPMCAKPRAEGSTIVGHRSDFALLKSELGKYGRLQGSASDEQGIPSGLGRSPCSYL